VYLGRSPNKKAIYTEENNKTVEEPEKLFSYSAVRAKMPRRSPPKLLSQSRSSETFEKNEQIATLSEARFWFGFQDAGFYQLSRAEWDNQKKKEMPVFPLLPPFPFPFSP